MVAIILTVTLLALQAALPALLGAMIGAVLSGAVGGRRSTPMVAGGWYGAVLSIALFIYAQCCVVA